MGMNKTFIKPLLINGSETASVLVSSAELIIKYVMRVIFIAWVAFIFLLPAKFMDTLYSRYASASSGTLLGTAGSIFLQLSGPVLILAILSIVYLIISGEEDQLHVKKSYRRPRFRLWTFPVLVDGPFGVVSATEFVGIVIISLYIIWALYSIEFHEHIPNFLPSKIKCVLALEVLGYHFSSIGLSCMVFLFLPVARGSVLLRIMGVPFEHATRYHVWLGHLTMLVFTLHGLFYVVAWAMDGVSGQLLEWGEKGGGANFAGVVCLLTGLLMWVTSLGPVRKRFFELFYYTHQLYAVYILFLAMHVGDSTFSAFAGGIFLFILDRFLRFCQSRRTVDIISTKSLPCGTLELILSKPANLRYSALSFIFLQIRQLSWLQWHPFSVSSSPLDGKFHVAVLIKAVGDWTEKLQAKLSSDDPNHELPKYLSPLASNKITASVEGPYGHEVPYHLMYEHLILVAGGIGVSPFLAVLSDILHRINEGKPCLSRNILLIWSVKKSDELAILSTIDMEAICPSFPDKVDLKIDIYVTRQSEPPLEQGYNHQAKKSCTYPKSNGRNISVMVGTGNNMWSGLYVVSSMFGFVILMALLNVLYIEPFGVHQLWYKGLLFVACMLASVFLFGGVVIGLWHVWERRMSAMEECDEADVLNKVDQLNGRIQKDPSQENVLYSTVISYGRRPDFKETFERASERWGNGDIGVLVCGPPTLQSSVAREIRSINIRRKRHQAIFHFNSHSFDL